jgi:hypothetical protein
MVPPARELCSFSAAAELVQTVCSKRRASYGAPFVVRWVALVAGAGGAVVGGLEGVDLALEGLDVGT